MAPDRMLEFDAEIRPLAETPVNRDFAPVAYYFDIALWSSQFHQGYRRFFRVLAGIPFATVAGALAVFLAAVVVAGRWRKRRLQFAAACSTAATGFTMIGLEMLLLLAFQALYGYVYQQLAVLIAAFMAGMALGSWLAMRKPAPAARAGMRVLATTQVLTTAAPLVLLALVRGHRPHQRHAKPRREPFGVSRHGVGFRHAGRIRVPRRQPHLFQRTGSTRRRRQKPRNALCARPGGLVPGRGFVQRLVGSGIRLS